MIIFKIRLKTWFLAATFVFALLLLNGCATAAPRAISPDAKWLDNRGEEIQAHGGGILKYGDMFYWFGEDRTRGLDWSKHYVSCYCSHDLTHWKFCNRVVQLSDPEHLGWGWVLERPKVFYNAKINKFVMYAHLDNRRYQYASVAVFTCDSIAGNYKYLKSFRPLGHESRDIGQFVDDDGTAYLISEDRPNGFHIYKLSDDDLSVEREMCLIPEHMEGGALVHYDGLYYVLGSSLSGWDPNPNRYATAASLKGPWSKFQNIAPPETKTYGSQSTVLLKVTGTKQTTVIFMGDLWKPRALWDSRYLWMPVRIGGGKLWLPQPEDWTLNIKTGVTAIKKSAPAETVFNSR